MRRKCNSCDLIGEDYQYFTISKKICNSCVHEKIKIKQELKEVRKRKRREYLIKYNSERKIIQKDYNYTYYRQNKHLNSRLKSNKTKKDKKTNSDYMKKKEIH